MRIKLPLLLKINRQILRAFILLSAIFLAACGEESLISVREESEANAIYDVLRESQIKSRKDVAGEGDKRVWNVMVGAEDYSLAVQVLEDHCLGRPAPEPIENNGLVSSMEVEKAREQRRLKIQIVNQLRQLNGATCVEVNISPAEDDRLKLVPNPATASILINYKTPVFLIGVADIQGMVARSVPGLKPENVNVVLSAKPLRSLPEKPAGGGRQFLLISGIGLTTILVFVGIVFFLQRRRAKRRVGNYVHEPNENALIIVEDENPD